LSALQKRREQTAHASFEARNRTRTHNIGNELA
jgi:hypothetical protein